MKLKTLIEQIVAENNRIHPKDDLLRGITYEALIDAVTSNEKTIDKNTIVKVFNELLNENIRNAKEDLRDNLQFILSNLTT